VALSEAARAVQQGETLRVLAVFAAAQGSHPLAVRREREALRRLFAERILPRRNVELNVLCHGVTRTRLKDAIRARRGYHVIRWSGHGHHNAPELQGEPGTASAARPWWRCSRTLAGQSCRWWPTRPRPVPTARPRKHRDRLRQNGSSPPS
jgi:hypothetical protein